MSSAKTLQISYIGMQTQEVAIKPNLKVILKSDTELLDEVTVVAYGTKRNQDLVGSISSVKNEIISNSQNSQKYKLFKIRVLRVIINLPFRTKVFTRVILNVSNNRIILPKCYL